MDSKKLAIGAVAIVVVAGAFILLKPAKNNNSSNQTVTTPTTAPASSSPSDQTPSPSAATQGTVKEFTVTGSNYKFEPATLAVNKGDRVRITFQNSGGFHNLVLDDFSVKSKTINTGASDTVEFTADKTGSFEYYCSISNHRAMGMKGTLTVQ